MEDTRQIELTGIGSVVKDGEIRKIAVEPQFARGLVGLEGFSHIIVLWWADRVADMRSEVPMEIELPYAPGTTAGLLATRSPMRPNPIGLNTCRILSVDPEAGEIVVDEIDAFAGTQVLDIKPYYGCIDRVKDYQEPDWVPGEWGQWYVPLPEIDYGS